MKKYTFLVLFMLVSWAVSAQKYRTAVGPRLSRSDFGVSIQQKVLERSTVEGILGIGTREVSGILLLEKHYPIIGKGFNWYIGGGAHGGNLKDHGFFYGVDAILGTEMKLPIFLLIISFDLQPAVHFNHEDWGKIGGAFTLRYILVKEKKEKRKLLDIFNRDTDQGRDRKNDPKKKDTRQEAPRKGGLFGL